MQVLLVATQGPRTNKQEFPYLVGARVSLFRNPRILETAVKNSVLPGALELTRSVPKDRCSLLNSPEIVLLVVDTTSREQYCGL